MALESYARNIFGSKQLGDLSVVQIKIGAGSGQAALIAADSSPEVTVATPGAGVYTITFRGGQSVFCVGQECVNSGTDKISVTALSQTNGVVTFTATKSDGADCAGSEQMHICFLVGSN